MYVYPYTFIFICIPINIIHFTKSQLHEETKFENKYGQTVRRRGGNVI